MLQQQSEESPNQPESSKKKEKVQPSNQNVTPEASTSSLQQNCVKEQKLSNAIKTDLNELDDILASPLECREYPKAAPRHSKKGRKRGISCIATDTPVKQEFEEVAKKREAKKRKNKNLHAINEKIKRNPKKVENVAKNLFSSSGEDSENSNEDLDVLSSGSDDYDISLSLLQRPQKMILSWLSFLEKSQSIVSKNY